VNAILELLDAVSPRSVLRDLNEELRRILANARWGPSHQPRPRASLSSTWSRTSRRGSGRGAPAPPDRTPLAPLRRQLTMLQGGITSP